MQGTTERHLTIIIIGRLIERLLLVGAGIFAIYVGYLLYVGGVSGNLNLKVETTGQSYQLENAAPGIAMALLGAFILIRSSLQPWERRIETEAGTEVQFLSDSHATQSEKKRDLNEDEMHSLFRLAYDALRRPDMDSDLKLEIRNVYRKLYDQTVGVPDEFSPERLPPA